MRMGNPEGVRRDFAALERRRMEAARLLRQGLSQSAVARELGVHRQSVSRWAWELEQSGVRGLRQAGRTGRPPKLSSAQLRDLERALKRGPEVIEDRLHRAVASGIVYGHDSGGGEFGPRLYRYICVPRTQS